MRRSRPAVHVLLLFIPLALLFGCGSDTPPEDRSEVQFEVIPDYLDEPYDGAGLGIRFRPPLGWEPLDDAQRARVAEALVADQDDDRYNLALGELFLHTDSLSFAAVSTVTRDGMPVAEIEEYVESFAAALGPDEDDEIRARGVFRMQDREITQFRHMVGDRVSFTLIFAPKSGTVVQIDYSIPASAYESEGIKLESSIGTLRIE